LIHLVAGNDASFLPALEVCGEGPFADGGARGICREGAATSLHVPADGGRLERDVCLFSSN